MRDIQSSVTWQGIRSSSLIYKLLSIKRIFLSSSSTYYYSSSLHYSLLLCTFLFLFLFFLFFLAVTWSWQLVYIDRTKSTLLNKSFLCKISDSISKIIWGDYFFSTSLLISFLKCWWLRQAYLIGLHDEIEDVYLKLVWRKDELAFRVWAVLPFIIILHFLDKVVEIYSDVV